MVWIWKSPSSYIIHLPVKKTKEEKGKHHKNVLSHVWKAHMDVRKGENFLQLKIWSSPTQPYLSSLFCSIRCMEKGFKKHATSNFTVLCCFIVAPCRRLEWWSLNKKSHCHRLSQMLDTNWWQPLNLLHMFVKKTSMLLHTWTLVTSTP